MAYDWAEPILNYHNHFLCLYPMRLSRQRAIIACMASVNVFIITRHEHVTTQTSN